MAHPFTAILAEEICMSIEQQGQSKAYHIIINAREHVWHEHRITYEDVVRLAFPDQPIDPTITYAVTYSHPHGHDGSLAPGQTTNVKERMIFNVVCTGRS